MLTGVGNEALQGGKEATHSNEILHRLIVEAIEDVAPEVTALHSCFEEEPLVERRS